MLNTEMLARLRTLLDEETEQFWTDTECYAALSDGQLEVIKISWTKWKPMQDINIYLDLPQVLRTLFDQTTETGQTGTSFPYDTSLYDIISVKVDTWGKNEYVPAIRRGLNMDKYKQIDNPYLQSSKSDFFYQIIPPNIVFEYALNNGKYVIDFLKKPADITASVQPTIDSIGHEAVIYYAFAFLLTKAKLPNDNALTIFTNLVSTL